MLCGTQTQILSVHILATALATALSPAPWQDTAPVLGYSTTGGTWHRRPACSRGLASNWVPRHRNRRDTTDMEKARPPPKAMAVTHAAPDKAPGTPHVPGHSTARRQSTWSWWSRRGALPNEHKPRSNHIPIATTSPAQYGEEHTSAFSSVSFWCNGAPQGQAVISGRSRHRRATHERPSPRCGRALQLTRDTPRGTWQRSKRKRATYSFCTGDPRATTLGRGRAGRRKLRPSRSRRGRTARWKDPEATSAPHSHHNQHHASDELIPRSKMTEKSGSSPRTQGKWPLAEAARRSCTPPANTARLPARLQHVSKQILFAYGQGNWRGRKKKHQETLCLQTSQPGTCAAGASWRGRRGSPNLRDTISARSSTRSLIVF